MWSKACTVLIAGAIQIIFDTVLPAQVLYHVTYCITHSVLYFVGFLLQEESPSCAVCKCGWSDQESQQVGVM